MEKSKENQSIFKKESIDDFLTGLKKWIGYRKLKLYYYGSYFYDIEGHFDVSEDYEVWPNEQLDDNQKKMKSSFKKETFWIGSISITESIQNQYLNLFQQENPGNIDILHVFKDSNSEKCETINALTSKKSPKELTTFIVTNDDTIKNKIKKSFKNHFELIKDSGSHIYFFPTVLRLKNITKVINVTTIISLKELNAEEIYYIKGGLSLCSESLITDTIKYLSEIASLEAIKSAIATIMSRNMSHNLGSHYLTNTKNYFRRRIDDDTLTENSDYLKADFRGATHLLQYMQERMDFIATVVSTDRYPLGSLNFKAEFFDILTNDDCGERHNKPEKNFLLQYLLHSEKYTRHGHRFDSSLDEIGDVHLQVKYDTDTYTGLKSKKADEQELKMKLSKLRLAVPGGIMARHALFTLVENILRNSAKHNTRNEKNKLTLTIELSVSERKITLSIYDNSQALLKDIDLCNSIKKRFDTIKIVDFEKNNVIDKTNKGLKEILICALWLKNEDVAQSLYDIQTGNRKVSDYLRITNKNDNLCYKIDLDIYDKFHFIKDPKANTNEIKINSDDLLSIHADYIVAKNDYLLIVQNKGEETIKKKLSEVFPRFVKVDNLNFVNKENEKEKGSINVVNGYIDCENEQMLINLLKKKYENNKLLIDNPSEDAHYNSLPNIFNVHKNNDLNHYQNDSNIIVFFDHYLNGGIEETKMKLASVPNAMYVDSISGENFTSTLTSPDFLSDDILRMKVIDSALTKIVVLDERIWDDYHSKWNDSKWQSKNITEYEEVWDLIKGIEERPNNDDPIWDKVFLFKEPYEWWTEALIKDKKPWVDSKKEYQNFLCQMKNSKCFSMLLMEKKNVFIYTMNDDYYDQGINSFKNLSNHSSAIECDFLTVHLGLIEKYLEYNKKKRIADFLKLIKSTFNPTYISIHSGRGNLSPELEEGLKSYPFISLSSVDAALGNSKYLLSELFKNTNYYGKGNLNNDKRI